MTPQLRTIDFFCGAGGFSEGLRQQGFDIVMGIDNWKPALESHNLNHGLNDTVRNILDFEGEVGIILALPDTEFIVGSPPCVNFSMSNRAGKADKALGIRLIEAYLRVVAVKKHQPGSKLLAWLMENVPNSKNFVKESYTFEDLDLEHWARSIGKAPTAIALRVRESGGLFTASDYGSPQSRQRFICGEMTESGQFPKPVVTHGAVEDRSASRPHLTLGEIKLRMPAPNLFETDAMWEDPNYPSLRVRTGELTDQFYDTSLYEAEWQLARQAKVNHPYMGRMSFPEDENRPSRTIMATRSASTRESIIFRSEYQRTGDGEYRLPTIREVATLMGFPYTYQFVGGEGSKWRQIGNAVCPHMAAALGKAMRARLGLQPIAETSLDFPRQLHDRDKVQNLNRTEPLVFGAPPRKKRGAKFRMQPFKGGNVTVALVNYDAAEAAPNGNYGRKWFCTVFVGAGKQYETYPIRGRTLQAIQSNILTKIDDGPEFIAAFKQHFDGRIGNHAQLQALWESNRPHDGRLLGPLHLVEEIARFIRDYDRAGVILENFSADGIKRDRLPKRQLLAMWALGQVASGQGA